MLFSSATFLFAFLPVVALLYYLIPKRCTAARNLFLTGASLLFYAWGEPRFVLVMLLVIVSSWLFARKIEASAKSARKGFLLVAVSVDLTVLFVFKYLGFFTENLNRLPFVRLPVPQITLPIGISFFTFQAISYVVDVYRGEAAQKSLWDVMLYIAFFPQLIAGPIVRYSDFADQIHNRQESLQNWNRGGYRFAIGLGKKVILSNNLAYVADAAFSSVGNLSFSMAWIGAVGYSLQLYFDFSGYSDMAIGLGQMFGFHFLENFNYPFISRSITELWRRWHISLGSWFRDYVNTLLVPEMFEKKDLYTDNPYAGYIGGDYGLCHIVNHQPPNDKRVLLVRDSFACAFTPYLAQACAELDTIDKRAFPQTIASYIEETKPDLVLFLYNAAEMPAAENFQ